MISANNCISNTLTAPKIRVQLSLVTFRDKFGSIGTFSNIGVEAALIGAQMLATLSIDADNLDPVACHLFAANQKNTLYRSHTL